MDTENLVQCNIRGVRNYEELKLLLNRTYTPIVTLQDCKLGGGGIYPAEGQLPRGGGCSYQPASGPHKAQTYLSFTSCCSHYNAG